MDRRILYSDNGTLSNWSVNLDNYHAGSETFTFVAAEDAIYIGARLPFNHLYFKIGTANTNASVINIAYWDSTQWRDSVETIDETSAAGKSLAQSGFITWVPSKTYGWVRSDTNYGGTSITGLTSVEIYDLYWLKITFSADLSASVSLSWTGQKFSNDNDLGSEYSDLVRSTMIAAYESGKTDWEEQHIRAAKVIIQDITAKNLIIEKEQILDHQDFKLAAVSKCAEIIYGGLGADYVDNQTEAKAEYGRRINSVLPRIDINKNAREEPFEKVTQGSLYR